MPLLSALVKPAERAGSRLPAARLHHFIPHSSDGGAGRDPFDRLPRWRRRRVHPHRRPVADPGSVFYGRDRLARNLAARRSPSSADAAARANSANVIERIR
jgi:hypothetical protein